MVLMLPVVIPEGWGLTIHNGTSNQALVAHFAWAEMPLE
jgi:hypothetical protein